MRTTVLVLFVAIGAAAADAETAREQFYRLGGKETPAKIPGEEHALITGMRSTR